jgi:hypothetical protein
MRGNAKNVVRGKICMAVQFSTVVMQIMFYAFNLCPERHNLEAAQEDMPKNNKK